jgi:hypothetical protein
VRERLERGADVGRVPRAVSKCASWNCAASASASRRDAALEVAPARKLEYQNIGELDHLDFVTF